MNDYEILQQIHAELKKIDKPPFDPSVIEFYGRLLERVNEEGFELSLLDKDLTESQEQALHVLRHYEYFGVTQRHQLQEGIVYHIDLRIGRFHEIVHAKSMTTKMQDSGKSANNSVAKPKLVMHPRHWDIRVHQSDNGTLTLNIACYVQDGRIQFVDIPFTDFSQKLTTFSDLERIAISAVDKPVR